MSVVNRYQSQTKFINRNPMYHPLMRKKGVNLILQYSTPTWRELTVEQISSLTLLPHFWGTGDAFYKLAAENYGDPELWWVIAWFNQKPADFLVKVGDRIDIPVPLEKVLAYYDV